MFLNKFEVIIKVQKRFMEEDILTVLGQIDLYLAMEKPVEMAIRTADISYATYSFTYLIN